MELVKKEFGPEANAKVEIKEGKLALVSALETKGVTANLVVAVDLDYFFDEVKAKIPGQIDDAIIEILKATLKAL